MANSAINGFATQVTDVPVGSFFGFDRWNGSSFSTVKILSEDLQEALSKHFLNANLTSTGNRSHDFDENDMLWGKVKTFRFEGTIAPTATYASFDIKGYGTTSSDISQRHKSQTGTTQEWYGDNTSQFFGAIGVGTAPNSTRMVYAQATGSNFGIYMQSVNGYAGYFNSTGSRGIDVTGSGFGGVFTCNDGNAIDCSGVNGGVLSGSQVGVMGRATASGGFGVFATDAGTSGAFALKTSGKIRSLNLPTYADNASALSGGLSVDDEYKTATGERRIVV